MLILPCLSEDKNLTGETSVLKGDLGSLVESGCHMTDLDYILRG